MSVKNAILILGLVVLVSPIFSQDVINQGFEVNTGTVGNNYMYMRADTFESKVPHCYSAGDFPNLDLISGSSLLFHPYSGDWFVGITPADLLTLELTSPLVTGNSYTITFFDMSKEVATPIEIGVSNHEHTFGDLVYTTTQAASILSWRMRSFTFVAPRDGMYISMRMKPGEDPRLWAGIDQLTIGPAQPCNQILGLGQDLTICPNIPITLQATGSIFTSYVWDDASSGNTKQINRPGTYILTGTVGECSVSDTIIITEGEVPEVDFHTDVQSGCSPLGVVFSYMGDHHPGYTFQWNFGDGNTSNQAGSVNHAYHSSSCFDVSLTVTSGDLCETIVTVDNYICVLPSPVAQFAYSPHPVLADNPEVIFTNTSIGNITNEWNFGDGFSSDEIHPIHHYPLDEGGEYAVGLIVASESGCTDTAWQTIAVKYPFHIYTPSSFTPDDDAVNSIFKPIVAAPFDVEEYKLEIYNRWGEAVFKSMALTDGWDGESSRPDIYTWKITVRNPYDKKPISMTGHVTLLR